MGKPKSWTDQANCQGMNTELFFPTTGKNIPRAVKKACDECVVRLECLDHAVVCNEQTGIWGGVNMRTDGPALRKAYRDRIKQIRFVKCKHPKTADNTNKYGQCITCRAEAVKRYSDRNRVDTIAHTP